MNTHTQCLNINMGNWCRCSYLPFALPKLLKLKLALAFRKGSDVWAHAGVVC